MHKYIRLMALLLCDAILVAASVYLSYLLRFDFKIRPQFLHALPYVMTVYTGCVLLGLYIFKIYKRIWQYASVGDIIAILKGAAIGSIGFYIFHNFIHNYITADVIVPRSIYLLTSIISILAVVGSRFAWRLFRDSYTKIQPHHRRALIIGAGEAGIMVVRELKHSHRSEIYPVAFIDDDDQKQKYEVLGIPVVGTREDIPEVVKQYKIDDIIVAIPTASRVNISDIINRCKVTGCQIKIVPRVNDLINGKISINMIRDVSVEDLLGREPVVLELDQITDYLTDKIVLVTGAGGSIGSELCRQVAMFSPQKLLLLGHGENSIYEIQLELKKKFPDLPLESIIADIQNKARMDQVFNEFRPEVVFHAAAHKHVPLMEYNPMEAIKNNVLGTKNVAECAHEFKAERFVMISTDKAVNPTNVMGATKKIAEMIVQGLDRISETQFVAVRFGNVLGSRGSVIPIFKKQIEEGGPVTVTHPEMIRYFMTIPEAVQLVIQAGALAEGGEIFILDMGKPVKIAELASDLIRLSGLEPDKDIKIIYTGIRPGEKLFEEILTHEEGAVATKHDRIFIGRPSKVMYEELKNVLDELEHVLNGEVLGKEKIKALLKDIVPSYTSQGHNKKTDLHTVNDRIQASLEMVAALEYRST